MTGRPVLGELSAEAKAARTPLRPEELVEALHDRVHRDPGRARAARTVRNSRRRQLSGAQHTAESWNAAYPVGTLVRYFPVYPPIKSVPPVETRTRSEAWALGDGSVVVLVEGRTGGVHLSHIEVI